MRKRKFETEDKIPVTLDLQDERASAFGRAVVFMRQAYPNMALMTYDNGTGRGAEHLVLAKLVGGIGQGTARQMLTYETCADETTADNVPGGLRSLTVTEDGHKVTCEIYPAVHPDEDGYFGAAAVHIVSDAPGVFVRFGCGNIAFMHTSPNAAMKGDSIDCEDGSTQLYDEAVTVRRKERDFITVVRGNFDFRICEKCDDNSPDKSPRGSYAEGETDNCEAWLMLGFSTDEKKAQELSALDPAAEIAKVKAYYKNLFEHLYIHTPDAELDEAFMHAYLNLSYSWVYPLGWIECIQHWPTMFHMEQTCAEEWAGHANRTRDTLLSQLRFMTENGCIIEINPNHTARRDWGGDNQFFFREALHYIRMTGDIDFARQIEPHMEKILIQTFGEYDSVGTGILGWHTQIGNQEDFESTPGHGAAPGSVGVRMLKELSELYDILASAGNSDIDPYREKAKKYSDWADYALEQWKKRIWKKDLGRGIWFSDDYGTDRLDTTYHGICYPVIFGQVDSFDAQSSLDHLLHRMTGHEGEVFQSNHFGDHAYNAVPTWGMQAGSNMQPFASAAYAKIGKPEQAIRPLRFVARRVCGPYQRGSFPETANEKRFGYFSPSAGVYAQGIIESIFGLDRNRADGTLTLSPCFPKSWDHSEICLPTLNMQYRSLDNGFTLTLRSDIPERKLLRWRTDLLKTSSVTVNGCPVDCSVTYECGFCELTADLGNAAEMTVCVTAVPMDFTVACPPIAVCGDKLPISVKGAELVGIMDRCGVFDENGAVRADLLDEYELYGDFGLVNFARRTFAVRVRCDNTVVTVPVSVTVLPRYLFRAVWSAEDRAVRLRVTNNSSCDIETALRLVSGNIQAKALLTAPAKGDGNILIPFDGTPVPGKNRAHLCIPGVWSGEITFEAPLDNTPEKLTLPKSQGMPYKEWKDIAYFSHHGCTVINPDAFLQSVPDSVNMDGLYFPLNGYFFPVDTRTHRKLTLPIERKARKLYVLFCAFADDHEICAPLFDAEIECEKGTAYLPPLYRKTLYFPGDFDYGFANPVVAGFSTYSTGVPRPSVLPPVGEIDYEDTTPPLYPARSLWCRNRTTEAGNAVFNLLEFDLGRIENIKTLTFIAKASDAAGGVFGVAII